METRYVYLIKSQKRLVITSSQINDEDYHFCVSSTSSSEVAYKMCQMFCCGYILGNKSIQVINSLDEFK